MLYISVCISASSVSSSSCLTPHADIILAIAIALVLVHPIVLIEIEERYSTQFLLPDTHTALIAIIIRVLLIVGHNDQQPCAVYIDLDSTKPSHSNSRFIIYPATNNTTTATTHANNGTPRNTKKSLYGAS
jgi:hypothetical protein